MVHAPTATKKYAELDIPMPESFKEKLEEAQQRQVAYAKIEDVKCENNSLTK